MASPTKGFGSRKYRVFLVEDHPVTREGFAQLIKMEDDLEVCGQAGTAQEATVLIDRLTPDLVILDLLLARTNGMELIKKLLSRRAELRILVLSTHDESLYAERALRAGAKGYVMKSEPTECVFRAIRQVLRGRVFLSERMNERLLGRLTGGHLEQQTSDVLLLSDREMEVFQLIGQGQSTTQIAANLHVSPSTVATHRNHIMEKLNLETMAELMRRAVEWLHSQGV